ncbi:MAG: hypothetical protein ACI4EN_08460 [Butyrivibrio sp.]
MKKFVRVFNQNRIKMVSGTAFIVACITALILFLSSTVYYSLDTGRVYNIISLLFSAERKSILDGGSISASELFYRENNGYMMMFAPIVAAIPYISVSSGSNNNNNLRFEIFRSGKTSYVLGNLFSAMTVGGIIFSVTYCIYGVVLYTVIGVGSYILKDVVLKIISMFLYGAVSVLPSYFLAVFIRNKYIVLCIPFMLNYLMILLWSKIIPEIVIQNEMAGRALEVMQLSNIQNVWNMGSCYSAFYVAWYTLIIIIIFIINRLYTERRCDCGGR